MKLFPLFIFWCLWFIVYSTRTVFSPILPLIEDALFLTHGKAGGLFTSLSIGYSFSLLMASRLASVWGFKKTVVIGFVGICLVFFGFQWIESYFSFHILFFFLGATTGAYIPSILPIITETYDHKHWGKAIGFHDSAASLSIFAVPILMAFGLNYVSWKRLLLIFVIISLILPTFFWKVSIEPKHEASRQRGRYIDLLKNRTTWFMGILWIFASASCVGVYSILPLYLIKGRGIEFSIANNLFGVSRIGGIFASILVGFLFDRYGYRRMLMLSQITAGLSTIGLSLASSLPLIMTTLILQATLSLTFFPVGLAALSKLTSLSERSMMIGLIVSFGIIFGVGISPFLLGLIADHFDFQTGIFGLGVLTTFSSLFIRYLEEK
jgi:NNP family nitrate/nitrite transporter-like MFS transporter